MADTSKREELIEALAPGVHECDGWMSDAQNAQLEWDGPNRVIHFCGQGSIDVGHLAAIAEAVFEQAQAPTDDEREALANLIPLDLVHDRGREGFPQDAFEAADAILAAGFRRTVQGEPTDAQVLAALNARELSVRERSGSAKHFNPAPDLSYYSAGNIYDMRAALRAAAATQTGEQA